MNPTQKIAKLREELESFHYDWRRTETRLREVEKHLSVIFIILMAQTVLFAAMVYAASLK